MSDNRQDPAAIEQDIRRTQDQIGDTVAKLEAQLNPRELARSVVGEDGNEIAREALEITRRNPIPVAMIAVGLIWLLATGRTRNGTRLVDRIAGALGGGNRAGARASDALRAQSAPAGARHAFEGRSDGAAAPIGAGTPALAV